MFCAMIVVANIWFDPCIVTRLVNEGNNCRMWFRDGRVSLVMPEPCHDVGTIINQHRATATRLMITKQ